MASLTSRCRHCAIDIRDKDPVGPIESLGLDVKQAEWLLWKNA